MTRQDGPMASTGCVRAQKKESHIAPLQPHTLASVKTWGILRELAVQLSRCKGTFFFGRAKR